MNNHMDAQQPASLGLDDILYLFFRHKWKIMFFSCIGVGVAAYFYLSEKTAYRSQAKLLIRYITEKKNPFEPGARDMQSVRPLNPREAAIISAEAEILRSSDSMVRAVNAVGPARVLEAYGGGTNVLEAAQLVMNNFEVDLAKNSSVMLLTLTHRDPEVAQRMLSEIIREYRQKHLEIHNSGATYDQIQAQTEEIRARLLQTEADLREQKKRANISSLEQSKADFAGQMTELRKSIFATEAELAEIRANIHSRTGASSDQTSTNRTYEVPAPAVIAKFNQLTRKLASLREHEAALRDVFTDTSTRVQTVVRQIAETEEQINGLPIDPEFIQAQMANRPAGQGGQTFDWQGARARLVAVEARYEILTNRLAQVREEAARLDTIETGIVQLERKKKMEEEEYAYYMKNLEEVRLEQTLDATRRNNISVVQGATSLPPERKKLMKKMGAASGAGIAFGFLLAFLIDYVFRPTVKRAKELENSVRVPVMASIPDFGRRKLRLKQPKKNGALAKTNGHALEFKGEIPPWDDKDPLLPYYEALRDRVVMSYNGDTHKPKIVGLTSCDAGAGVSRLSTGLAAALSRDAQRNVLLVGLQRNKVAVSAFAKGLPADGISPAAPDALPEKELVAQNLHSLATTGRNLAGASVVQSFSELLPQLQICDYDYIIFDLPPLTQTSGSLRLASQMERTLLVVHAEHTSKNKVKRAKNLLKSSHANVFAVLNKSHGYGPKSLRDDI